MKKQNKILSAWWLPCEALPDTSSMHNTAQMHPQYFRAMGKQTMYTRKIFSCNSQDVYCDCFWFKLPWIKWCPLQKYIRWGKPSKTWGKFPWNSLFWWRSLMHWCWKLCHLLDQLSSSSGCSCASDCQCTNSNAVRGKSYLHQGAYTGGRNVIRGKLFVRFVKF